MKMVLATILVLSAGCGYVDGACWARNDDGQGSGAGGGPIVPGGVGGYGESYAEPQGLDPDSNMPEECRIEACHDKCDRGRDEDLHGCQKLPAEKQDGCRQRAKERAAECYKACERDNKTCTDMYEACIDKGHPCTRQIDWKMTLCEHCRNDCQNDRPYKYQECYQCGFQ